MDSFPEFYRLSRLSQTLTEAWRFVRSKMFVGAGSSSSPELEKEIAAMLDDLKSVERTLGWMNAALVDAEEKAVRGEHLMKQWLKDIQKLAYRASDLVGLYEYEVIAQEVRSRGLKVQNASTCAKTGERKFDQVHESSPLFDPFFLKEFARGVNDFRKELEEINKHKAYFHFDKEDGEKTIPKGGVPIENLPTGSEPVDNEFFGRDHTMEEMIQLLATDNIEEDGLSDNVPVPVIALVGMGGVGKTTLAQHAYNDKKVCKEYPMKGWVSVSDDFQVQKLTRSTLEALVENSSYEEFSILQRRLKDAVRGNKFLLVLDNVWNEGVQAWDTFYSSLKDGAKGSKIIITTRSKIVADTSQASKCIDVGCLSEEDAWALFEMIVFGSNKADEVEHPILVEIGKKIARKCQGLPLAIKVLGRSLKQHQDEGIWNDTLKSSLWEKNLWEEGKQVLGPLMLSYLHLPAHLKRCFVLSSVFPKNKSIKKKDLVELWMAHDLVEDCKQNIGMYYIQFLMSRSFFQLLSIKELEEDDIEDITIHDHIHDLAQLLSNDNTSYYLTGDDRASYYPTGDDNCGQVRIDEDVQHAYIFSARDVELCCDGKYNSSLRTLFVKYSTGLLVFSQDSRGRHTLGFGSPNRHVNFCGLRTLIYPKRRLQNGWFSHDFLKSLKNLRHLDAPLHAPIQEKIDAIGMLFNLRTLKLELAEGERNATIPVRDFIADLKQLTTLKLYGRLPLPDSIGSMTKLYSLEFEHLEFEYFPDAIHKLVNLRELMLSGSMFQSIPESIGNLRALQVLDLNRCQYLEELPESIGNLRDLRVLDLRFCTNLEKLPRTLIHLRNMVKLDVWGTPVDCYFPAGFGSLTKLQKLPVFRVSPKGSEHAGIEELGDLASICGELKIEGLDNVVGQTAIRAELTPKKNLKALILEWGNDLWKDPYPLPNEAIARDTEDEQVLDSLKPHINLKRLSIERWRGRRLASWLGNESFLNLETIDICNLPYCTTLWPLHQLPSLKRLVCFGLSSLVCLVPPSCLHYSEGKGYMDSQL